MNKLTKKQQLIYNWLVSKPGYLKKTKEYNWDRTLQDFDGCNVKDTDFDKAWNMARLTKKESIKTKKLINSFIVNPTTEIIKDAGKKGYLKDVIAPKVVRDGIVKPQIIQHIVRPNLDRNIPGAYYITGCGHAPWQNKAMYNSVFNYLSKEVDLQGIILAGDMVDLNSLSSHDKGKIPMPGVTLGWEYQEANKFLDEFDSLKVKGTKDYIFGNHEDRYLRAMKDVDTSKLGNALMSPQDGLNLLKRGYNVYTNWKDDAIHLGPHLDVCHGEFLNVHTAKKTIDTYRKSCVYFHTHRYQIFVEGRVGGFNMGFGGDINAPIFGFATRAMKNSWVNCSTLATLDKDGYYHILPLVFMNGKLFVNGKSY